MPISKVLTSGLNAFESLNRYLALILSIDNGRAWNLHA